MAEEVADADDELPGLLELEEAELPGILEEPAAEVDALLEEAAAADVAVFAGPDTAELKPATKER